MKSPVQLNVISSPEAWYADGLDFTCSQCGNCCTGAPGYVYLNREEIRRLAEHLNLTPQQTIDQYCRKVGSRISLKEKRGRGGYDCIFLEEIQATRRPEGADHDITYTKRICSIYNVRPLQCRTWPFWDGNLASKENWNAAAQRCPGMNTPGRRFDQKQIENYRDAKDWPENPPSSAK
jgi:Fe-S-cluster containining protein